MDIFDDTKKKQNICLNKSTLSFLSNDQRVDLRIAHRKCKDKKLAYRYHAILLLDKGYTYSEIAEILFLDDDTIRKYSVQYQEEGMVGLERNLCIGSSPMLNQEEIQWLSNISLRICIPVPRKSLLV